MSVTSVVEGFTRMFLHWRNATRENGIRQCWMSVFGCLKETVQMLDEIK